MGLTEMQRNEQCRRGIGRQLAWVMSRVFPWDAGHPNRAGVQPRPDTVYATSRFGADGRAGGRAIGGLDVDWRPSR